MCKISLTRLQLYKQYKTKQNIENHVSKCVKKIDQWTYFYVIGTSNMKELKFTVKSPIRLHWSHTSRCFCFLA